MSFWEFTLRVLLANVVLSAIAGVGYAAWVMWPSRGKRKEKHNA